MMTTKYGINIDGGPKVGWDALGTHADAVALRDRAANRLNSQVEVYSIEVPEHVDHLYQSLTCGDDTALYDARGNRSV